VWNQATDGGGIFVLTGGSEETSLLEIGNSILATNAANTPDFHGEIFSLDHNLIGDLTGGSLMGEARFDQTDILPAVAEDLNANGGPTLTVALESGSPAVNRGRCLRAYDQRGFYRSDGWCDIGAFERGATAAPPDADLVSQEPTTASSDSLRLSLPSESFSHVIALDGVFLQNPGEIGVDAVLNQGVIAAVDIFTFGDGSAAGGSICLRGTGHMIFLGAEKSPRIPVPLGATVHDGYTCAVLPGDGTAVLVKGMQ
jgi:hypothetical protein